MATAKRDQMIGTPEGDEFVNRMMVFKEKLATVDSNIDKKKKQFSAIGKELRELEKDKAAVMEAITKYVLNSQRALV